MINPQNRNLSELNTCFFSSFDRLPHRVSHINFNLYHYAGNNPVKYLDPDGRAEEINYTIFKSHGNRKEGNYWSEYIVRNEISENLDMNLFCSFSMWVLNVNSQLHEKNKNATDLKIAFENDTYFLSILESTGLACPQLDCLILILTPVINASAGREENEWGKFMQIVGSFDREIQMTAGISIGLNNLADRDKINSYLKDFKFIQKKDTVTVNVQNLGKYKYNLVTIELSAEILNAETGKWEKHAYSWHYASDYTEEF